LKAQKHFFLTCLILSALILAKAEALAESQSGNLTYNSTSTVDSNPSDKSDHYNPAHPSSTGTPFLQGEVIYTVPRGTLIKLKLASVPTYPLKLMERDLDGNLYPAKLGQEITATTSEDIYVDDNKVIPEGTIFHGRVSKILPPRRVYRQGSLVISFDNLTTPDGKKFAFTAQADNFRPSTWKTKAKGFGIIAANAAGGGIVGALVAYQIFGWQDTVAMHGYNIAGGAAAGALIATGYAIMRHGPQAVLEPGDDLKMQIDTDLLMPVASEPKAKKQLSSVDGLTIKVEKSKIVSDGLDGHMFTCKAWISNEGDHSLSSIDLYLEDTNGNRSPLCANDDDDSSFLFTVEPHSKQHVNLTFTVPYPKLKHQLVWIEHEDKQVCYRQPLP